MPAFEKVPELGSKISSVFSAPPELCPPAMSTRPSCKTEAVAPERASFITPACAHESALGSYISAALVMPPPEVVPPATSTRPSCSTAQDWCERGEFMLAAADQLPVVLKRSAVAVGPLASAPPLMSRRPSLKTTVHAPLRAADKLPAATQVPVATVGNDAQSKRLMPKRALSRRV